jgi:hypothetical protein
LEPDVPVSEPADAAVPDPVLAAALDWVHSHTRPFR